MTKLVILVNFHKSDAEMVNFEVNYLEKQFNYIKLFVMGW